MFNPYDSSCEKPATRIKTISSRTLFIYKRFCLGIEKSNTKEEMKPIGLLIKEELLRQERGITWFARKLACDRSNIYRIFDKESIDTGLLLRISLILQHDFFSEYTQLFEQRRKELEINHK